MACRALAASSPAPALAQLHPPTHVPPVRVLVRRPPPPCSQAPSPRPVLRATTTAPICPAARPAARTHLHPLMRQPARAGVQRVRGQPLRIRVQLGDAAAHVREGDAGHGGRRKHVLPPPVGAKRLVGRQGVGRLEASLQEGGRPPCGRGAGGWVVKEGGGAGLREPSAGRGGGGGQWRRTGARSLLRAEVGPVVGASSARCSGGPVFTSVARHRPHSTSHAGRMQAPGQAVRPPTSPARLVHFAREPLEREVTQPQLLIHLGLNLPAVVCPQGLQAGRAAVVQGRGGAPGF